MKRSLVWLALVATLAILAACTSAPNETKDVSTIGNAANGEKLFTSGGASAIPCMTCHTLDGSPLVGPSLLGIGERAGTRIEGVTAEDYIRQSIVSPSTYIVEGYSDTMNKTYSEYFSEDDINDLIAFLLNQ